MFLEGGSIAKVVLFTVSSASAVALVFVSNNPYVRLSTNYFRGNNSLVRYSENPELEDVFADRYLTTEEDMRLYAAEKGCTFSMSEKANTDNAKTYLKYHCRDGKFIEFKEDKRILPTPLKSNEFVDFYSGKKMRVCSGWESFRRFFGAKLGCAYRREKWFSDRAWARDRASKRIQD